MSAGNYLADGGSGKPAYGDGNIIEIWTRKEDFVSKITIIWGLYLFIYLSVLLSLSRKQAIEIGRPLQQQIDIYLQSLLILNLLCISRN